jgi:hypothetical protein
MKVCYMHAGTADSKHGEHLATMLGRRRAHKRVLLQHDSALGYCLSRHQPSAGLLRDAKSQHAAGPRKRLRKPSACILLRHASQSHVQAAGCRQCNVIGYSTQCMCDGFADSEGEVLNDTLRMLCAMCYVHFDRQRFISHQYECSRCHSASCLLI